MIDFLLVIEDIHKTCKWSYAEYNLELFCLKLSDTLFIVQALEIIIALSNIGAIERSHKT